MGSLHVSSEIGRLRKVIVHSPGPELLAVTPQNRQMYLYDDIIDLEYSREEHRRFTSILKRFTTVLEIRDLLEETLAEPEALDFLLARSVEVTGNRELRDQIGSCDTAELVSRYVEGWRLPPGLISERLERRSYVLPPLPNLYFTRDAAVVVGDSVLIASMRFQPRWPEEVLLRTIFGFHPELGGEGILYDGSDERRHDYRIEGGDVHPLADHVVAIGLSQRTSAAAIDAVTELLFQRTAITDVIAVVLPDPSTAIHLDMVWTHVDQGVCVAHPPMFRGPTRVPVLHRHKGKASLEEPATLFDALRDVGLPMEPIWAGGDRPETREREQWASGCNFLAVAPGTLISYARNEATLRAMEDAGFRIIAAEELLLGDDEVRDGERAVITFVGAELVRGGGGPRCMTCPVMRDRP